MSSIYIYKGDDTDFADERTITIDLTGSSFDFTGYSAEFELRGVRKQFSDISSGTVSIVLSAADTRHLSLGKQYASLKLFDADGRVRTVANRIPFDVVSYTDFSEEGEYAISVTLDASDVTITFTSSLIGGGEYVSNKVTTIRADGVATDIKYPSEKAARTALDLKADKGTAVYTASGLSALRTLSGTSSIDDLCNVIGTLIADLKVSGVIK